jgi:branched-chain amino acid transport system substrate-binding protein
MSDRLLKRRVLVVALTVVALASFGFSSARGGRTAGSGDELTIGALLDLSDGWTSLGRASRVTLRLAAADANARLAKSGSGLRVRLKIVDVHGDPQASARALRRLTSQGVQVAIGPQASSEVRAVRAAADSLGTVVISQGSTASALAIRGDNVLRFVPDDRRESEALVALLKRDEIDAIVPVWRNDLGNAGLARSTRRRFSGAGGSVAKGVRYGTDVSDFGPTLDAVRAQVAALRSRGASRVAVYLAGFDEVVGLFQAAMGDQLLGSLPWYGSDGVALSSRLLAADDAAAFAASVGYPNPILGLADAAAQRSRRLVRRIETRLGRTPDAFALSAYDAFQVAVRASARAGGAPDPDRLRRALVAVGDGYRGASGRLALNAAGDRAYGSYDFWSVCTGGAAPAWKRTWSYLARAPGSGRLVARERC